MLEKKWQHCEIESFLFYDDEPSVDVFEGFEPEKSEWGNWHIVASSQFQNSYGSNVHTIWRRLLIQKEENINV